MGSSNLMGLRSAWAGFVWRNQRPTSSGSTKLGVKRHIQILIESYVCGAFHGSATPPISLSLITCGDESEARQGCKAKSITILADSHKLEAAGQLG